MELTVLPICAGGGRGAVLRAADRCRFHGGTHDQQDRSCHFSPCRGFRLALRRLIALHAEKGYDVTVVCLSFGERGESAKLWKHDGMTLDRVKDARRAESERDAKALGVHDLIEFDLGDYPLHLTQEDKFRLVDVIRKVQPSFMLSHSQYDPYNTDHTCMRRRWRWNATDRPGLGP